MLGAIMAATTVMVTAVGAMRRRVRVMVPRRYVAMSVPATAQHREADTY